MATLTINSISFDQVPVIKQEVNIKYRLTSNPDIAASYVNLGNFMINPNGILTTPLVISGLTPGVSYTIWGSMACSNSQILKSFTTLFIPCGSSTSFTGSGIFYPKTFQITAGSTTGPILFTFQANAIPDRFVIRDGATVLYDTGYVGDPGNFQTAINDALAGMGYPPATVTDTDGRVHGAAGTVPAGTGLGSGGVIVNKTTTNVYLFVDVYSIIEETNYFFVVGCPNGSYFHSDHTEDFVKNDCTLPLVGSTVSYTKTYYSQASQAEADALNAADSIYDIRGQAYANANGTCS